MYTFARPDGDSVAPSKLQLYCHFEIHLDKSLHPCDNHEAENDHARRVAMLLEEFINTTIESETGFRAEVYFHKWLPKNAATSYMIALFGDREPITKEKADTIRLTIKDALKCNNESFPLIDRGSWSISKPRPVSLLPKTGNVLL
jgi:hypothetical protein